MSDAVSSTSIQSTSVRGVMTPRTARSPRRMTPAIILRSSVSITPAVSASAMMVLISSSVTVLSDAVLWPKRRKISLVEASSSQTTGAPIREISAMSGATVQAIPSAFFSARCLGTSSPTTTER